MTEAAQNFHFLVQLVPLGFTIAAYGALIGVGGGFILVPILFLLMPGSFTPATITSMSLIVVFCNSYAGALVYTRIGRVYYPYGILFGLAGIPAVVLGTKLVREIPREPFAIGFGLLLFLLGGSLALWPEPSKPAQTPPNPGLSSADTVSGIPISEAWCRGGTIASAYMQFLAGFLGIGGGVIQMPFLVRVMRFQPHAAAATSLVILCIASGTGMVSHLVQDLLQPGEGAFFVGMDKAMFLAVGAMLGAPLGALLSQYIRGRVLVRLLALALCIVGIQLLWNGLAGMRL